MVPVLNVEQTAKRASDFFKNNSTEFTDCIEASVKLDADYTKRFDVGDIVTIYSSRLGISADMRITEISESFTTSGLRINTTFGEPMKCLKQMIGGQYGFYQGYFSGYLCAVQLLFSAIWTA